MNKFPDVTKATNEAFGPYSLSSVDAERAGPNKLLTPLLLTCPGRLLGWGLFPFMAVMNKSLA
jgi:hypothetical protein